MLSKVEELIDPHSGQLDEVLLRDVFSPVDIQRILQIRLNTQGLDDFVAWNYTWSGTFSVRSSYHRELEHQHGVRSRRVDGQGVVRLNPVWKDCWSLRLPEKIKHFLWKGLRENLPCYGILAGRHIPCSPQCPMCSIGVEDIQHYLFTCSRAQEVWTELGLRDTIRQVVAQDR